MKKLAIIDARYQQHLGSETINRLETLEFIDKIDHRSNLNQRNRTTHGQTVIIFVVNEYDFKHVSKLENKLMLFCKKSNAQFAKIKCTSGHYDVIQRDRLIEIIDKYAQNDNVVVVTPEWLDDQAMHERLSVNTEELIPWVCRHYLPTIAKDSFKDRRFGIVDFENMSLEIR